MQKILTIKPTQILSGLTAYKQNANYGILYDADGLNPAISGGALSLSQSPVDISGGVVADSPIAFLGLGDYLYSYGSAGKIYRITNPTATPPTVSLIHTNAQTATWGFESITTKVGGDYIVYFSLDKIGLISTIGVGTDTFNDVWKALTYGGRPHPVYRIADRIYYGSGNYVGMIYDDLTNAEPQIITGDDWLSIGEGEEIHSLTSDGQYLIIGADEGSAAKLETIVYFYDPNNRGDGFGVKRYIIQDKLVKFYTKKGITYALCTNGLWAFTLGSAPQKISEAITGVYGTPNIIDESVDALLIGGNTVVQSYGKLSPEFPNARFNPISDVQGYVTALYSQVSNTRAFIGASGKIYYCDYYTQRVCTDDVITTGYLDLPDYYSIDQIDLIFQDQLQTGDSAQVRARVTESGVEGLAYSDFTTISNTDDPSKNSAPSSPVDSSGKVVGDKVSLEITLNGVCVPKQIIVYGSPKTR
jgi:hypothetical protein